MQYMLLLYAAPGAGPADGSPEQAAEMPLWMAYTEAMVQAGEFVSGEPLHGPETSTTVRIRDGEVLTTDGPFAETKEVIGGFYIVDVDNLDKALEWAAKCPIAPYGSIEVRPVMVIPEG